MPGFSDIIGPYLRSVTSLEIQPSLALQTTTTTCSHVGLYLAHRTVVRRAASTRRPLPLILNRYVVVTKSPWSLSPRVACAASVLASQLALFRLRAVQPTRCKALARGDCCCRVFIHLASLCQTGQCFSPASAQTVHASNEQLRCAQAASKML